MKTRFFLTSSIAIAAAAALAPAIAQEGTPRNAPAVISPALERKISEARASGAWVVEEGEDLAKISRLLATDEAHAALARDIRAANPAAFTAADAMRPLVGARLQLPARVRLTPAEAAAPAAMQAAAAPAAPYVDRLIGGAAEADASESAPEGDASPGLRSSSVEYRLDRREQNTAGSALSQGVAFRHHAETERYGDFTVEGEAGREGVVAQGRESLRTVGRATLYHDQFALTEDMVASSALGTIRLGLSPWLSNSFRIFLPASLAQGAATTIDMPGTQVRAGIGRLGRLRGVAVQGFEYLEGTLAQLEATSRLSESWQVGGALVGVRGADQVRDHTALTLATEFALPSTGARFKVQGVGDSDGQRGLWADGQYRYGRLAQRFGAYHLDPDLVFGESSALRDMRGAYWRGEYRAPSYTSAFGVEANEGNLRRDPLRGGNLGAGGYANISLRLDRSTQVGAGLAVREETPRTPTGTRRGVDLLNAFLSRQTVLGVTRLDVSLNRSRPQGLPSESTRTYSWNQEWGRFASVEVSTLLALSVEGLAERDVRRRTASVVLRGPAFEKVRWDAAFTYVDVDDADASERNYNAAVGFDWPAARDWILKLQWIRNQVQPSAANPVAPFIRENVVQFSAHYEETRGTPYPRVQGASGRSGTGWVEGSVFFDENADGARQANERGAAGVMVILDGRSTQITDKDGRFSFGLVGAGDHTLTLSVERVPLPWGLADEAPRKVRVDVREGTRFDVPLARIAP